MPVDTPPAKCYSIGVSPLLSQDLLDFIQGPLATHQKRLLQLLLDWQESVLHRLPVDTAEMAHMLQLSEAMMALMYHLVWMTTGQDIEIKEAPDDRTVG